MRLEIQSPTAQQCSPVIIIGEKTQIEKVITFDDLFYEAPAVGLEPTT